MISMYAQIAFEKGYRVKGNHIISAKGRVRSHTKSKTGEHYPKFGIKVKGKVLTIKCHQLSAWQKFGKDCLGEEIHIRHIDDDPDHFDPKNIELGTKEDNNDDRYINSLLQQWIEEVNQAAK